MNKITYHPSDELLYSHANGDLPESLSVAVSLHCELCAECQAKSDKLMGHLADETWQEIEDNSGVDFSDMLASITSLEVEDSYLMTPEKQTLVIANKEYTLPFALQRYSQIKWNHLGAVSRARLIEEQDTRSNLLHIQAGGVIPSHTHKGYELTLLLDGSFEDESGIYHKGDFIWLDTSHHHSPKTKEGCLCYTVQNAPLHFTQGISKLFNPISNLLY